MSCKYIVVLLQQQVVGLHYLDYFFMFCQLFFLFVDTSNT